MTFSTHQPGGSVGSEVGLDLQAMESALEAFLRAAGLPEAAQAGAAGRAAGAWAESLLAGYRQDPVQVLQPTWPERSGSMISVSGIPFVSVCAHHLLPFFGRAHVAYLPAQELTGLSRIEQMVWCLSRRLQLQEKLGEEIVEAMMTGVSARGAACILEAEHLCVFARGQRQRGTLTRSVAFAGQFEHDHDLQDRCLALLGAVAPGR